MSDKFNAVLDRLNQKIKLSQTPVPGFILGLSGTDSIITFILLYKALSEINKQDRLVGIHYINDKRKNPTWFEANIIPWIKEQFPETTVLVETPLGGNQDQQRWADLHLRALNDIVKTGDGSVSIRSYDQGQNYWVASCTNATELALGTYSIMSKSASINPVISFYKHEIIDLCYDFDVPKIAMEMSEIPDCLCGRAEIAAQNILLIDEIISFKLDLFSYDIGTLSEVYAYVKETRSQNGFKARTPFSV